jgi:hypothetical protein
LINQPVVCCDISGRYLKVFLHPLPLLERKCLL